jgi:hypothetical protein
MFSEGLQMKRMLWSTALLVLACATGSVPAPPVTPPPRLPEVPAGFDTLTNGRVSQEQHKFRTAALWGLRARSRLLHDGRALTPGAAIQAHHVEAEETLEKFNGLSDQDRASLLAFLASL